MNGRDCTKDLDVYKRLLLKYSLKKYLWRLRTWFMYLKVRTSGGFFWRCSSTFSFHKGGEFFNFIEWRRILLQTVSSLFFFSLHSLRTKHWNTELLDCNIYRRLVGKRSTTTLIRALVQTKPAPTKTEARTSSISMLLHQYIDTTQQHDSTYPTTASEVTCYRSQINFL